jgi:hypothetical protein
MMFLILVFSLTISLLSAAPIRSSGLAKIGLVTTAFVASGVEGFVPTARITRSTAPTAFYSSLEKPLSCYGVHLSHCDEEEPKKEPLRALPLVRKYLSSPVSEDVSKLWAYHESLGLSKFPSELALEYRLKTMAELAEKKIDMADKEVEEMKEGARRKAAFKLRVEMFKFPERVSVFSEGEMIDLMMERFDGEDTT